MIILAEDQEQQNLVRHYLKRCGHRNFRVVPPAAKGPGGSGEKYVRDQYAIQVRACRSSLGKRASAMLIVIVDADMQTTQARYRQLEKAIQAAGGRPRQADEPIVVLIPKRHVETWIRALLGHSTDETTDYSAPAPTATEIKQAAANLQAWMRGQSGDPRDDFPPSLIASRDEWKRIP